MNTKHGSDWRFIFCISLDIGRPVTDKITSPIDCLTSMANSDPLGHHTARLNVSKVLDTLKVDFVGRCSRGHDPPRNARLLLISPDGIDIDMQAMPSVMIIFRTKPSQDCRGNKKVVICFYAACNARLPLVATVPPELGIQVFRIVVDCEKRGQGAWSLTPGSGPRHP